MPRLSRRNQLARESAEAGTTPTATDSQAAKPAKVKPRPAAKKAPAKKAAKRRGR